MLLFVVCYSLDKYHPKTKEHKKTPP